jgi:hypothetical protein
MIPIIAPAVPVVIKISEAIVPAATPALSKLVQRGNIVLTLAGASEELDRLLNYQLDRNIDKERRKKKRDNQTVVKMLDVVEVLEDQFKSAKALRILLDSIVEIAVSTEKGSFDLAGPLISKIEARTLRQDTPRVLQSKRFYHRPAKGHGVGRVG